MSKYINPNLILTSTHQAVYLCRMNRSFRPHWSAVNDNKASLLITILHNNFYITFLLIHFQIDLGFCSLKFSKFLDEWVNDANLPWTCFFPSQFKYQNTIDSIHWLIDDDHWPREMSLPLFFFFDSNCGVYCLLCIDAHTDGECIQQTALKQLRRMP